MQIIFNKSLFIAKKSLPIIGKSNILKGKYRYGLD